MPNQTLDLRRGLEAWYDLDPRYYDNQRGVLADKSGYGRHAEANASPTLGVEGPASFNATDFSGDDKFRAYTPESGNEQTIFAIAKLEDVDNNVTVCGNQNLNQGGASIYANNSQDRLSIGVTDDGGNNRELILASPTPTENWLSVAFTYNGTVLSGYLNDESAVVVENNVGSGTNAPFGIGVMRGDYSGNMYGEIASVGRWSRALSDAEIHYLNNLTAPPRSL